MKTALPTLNEVVTKPTLKEDCSNRFREVQKYARFLNQPLKLEFFIPCNDKGEPLEEPDLDNDYYWDVLIEKAKENGFSTGSSEDMELLYKEADRLAIEEYQKAKDRVLFKEIQDFGWIKHHLLTGEFLWEGKPIKQISNLTNKVELTEAGIKQSGL